MAENPAVPARPRRGCLSGCSTLLLLLIVVAALRGLFVKPNADVPAAASPSRGAATGSQAPRPPGTNTARSTRAPMKGDRAQLARSTPLYFNDALYRQGNAGEQFKVLEYRPETKKVYLLLHGADGKPLACNVPAEAVTIVSAAPLSAPVVTPPPAATPPPRYQVVKHWLIPNDGEGSLIVIAPAFATDAGMKAIGEKLRDDTSSDRFVFILIFDDVRAAQMYDRLDNLTSTEEAFYDRHFMGRYMRNATNGVHDMDSHPSGISGPSRTINF